MIRAKAPLRISFAGGGTDVSPYPQLHGGMVLSTTIDKYAYVSLSPIEGTEVKAYSHDYDIAVQYDLFGGSVYDGRLDVVKAVMRNMFVRDGAKISMHCDAPPGSGLGSSSAMIVALIGAAQCWQRQPMTDYEIAGLAYYVEREDLGIIGGLQDQYEVTFGGFNFIEFFDDTVLVNQLRVSPSILNELEYRLLLVYTGSPRPPDGFAPIIRQQIAGIERGDRALERLKEITLGMKCSLLQGDLDLFGDLLHFAWQNKKRVAGLVSNDKIDEMYEVARKYGAMGGKILGAGGGGYLLLCCDGSKKHIVADHMIRLGGTIVGFGLEEKGLQTWMS